ncbi:hypothetical protein C8R45DRAFT_1028905 [Mycena sanguinolenta]|nr:hypothetical protein C8R45DRAFT_1028905 [Mycena sanguinolenta]
MHRTFHIPEILDLIFAQLQDHFPDRKPSRSFSDKKRNKILGRGDLAALARTCKTFCDPALDLLWREQETLANLLKCLPSHLWKEESKQISSTYTRYNFSMTGSISPADWNIPLAYATRIRKLALDWRMNDYCSSIVDVFEMIAGSELSRDYLCPNLHALAFHCNKVSLYLPLFLGPKIMRVDISLPYGDSSSIPDLPLRYPELRTLSLFFYSNPRSSKASLCSSALSKVTMALSSIECLTLPMLDQAALEHVSQLSGLRSLDVDTLILAAPRVHSRLEPRVLSFSALHDVYLEDTTPEVVIQFLESLSNCGLTRFRAGITESITKSTTRKLYAALADHLSHPVFQTLSVGLPEDGMDTPLTDPLTNYAIDGSILSTLLCFTNLTDIYLEPPIGFVLDDTMAWDIARAWPKVKSLHLTGSTDERRPSSMSLLGLTAFAKHCRELTRLSIGLDASTVPPLDDLTEPIVPQSSLTYLSIDMSPINDPHAVAGFVSVLFPNLASIQTHDGWRWGDFPVSTDEEASAYDRIKQWKQVDALLRRSKGASK